MSVYIKGMKMPASCAGCYMFLHGLTMDGHPWQECAVTERELDDPFGCGKPDWCPITEIKEPHGRLIDADALIAAHKDVCSRSMKFNLDLAPTVIETEEENNECSD